MKLWWNTSNSCRVRYWTFRVDICRLLQRSEIQEGEWAEFAPPAGLSVNAYVPVAASWPIEIARPCRAAAVRLARLNWTADQAHRGDVVCHAPASPPPPVVPVLTPPRRFARTAPPRGMEPWGQHLSVLANIWSICIIDEVATKKLVVRAQAYHDALTVIAYRVIRYSNSIFFLYLACWDC